MSHVSHAARAPVLALLLSLAAAGATAVAAAPPPLARTRTPAGESVTLAPGDGTLLVLVHPAGEPDGVRRLLRLVVAPEPRAETVLEELPGWIKALAALDLGSGPELVAAGLGRAVSLGPLARPSATQRPLLEHPGFDLRSLSPEPLRVGIDSRLTAAEAGHLRVWEPERGGLRLTGERALPVAVERTASGLVVASPRVAAVGRAGDRRWLIGPSPEGGYRLRTLLVPAGEGAAVEAWSALPGAEAVERSWAVTLDGEPAIVVRAQGAGKIDLLEPQRLRVFVPASDRTRAGAPPAFATELDAKRWQESEVLAADADGDGHDDLLAVYPEGLTGGDLVIEIWRGQGGGRFEARPRRTDLEETPEAWRLLPAATAAGGPALVVAGRDRLALYAVASGRRALEPAPRFSVPRPPDPQRSARPAVLGVAELDGRPGPEAIFLLPGEKGGSRLVVARAAAPPRAP